MPRNSDIYKSFTTKPVAAYIYPQKTTTKRLSSIETEELEIADLKDVLNKINKYIRTITSLTEWYLSHGKSFLEEIRNAKISQNNTLGKLLGVTIPKDIAQVSFTGLSGKSRYDMLLQDRFIREAKSWIARKDVADNTSENKNSRYVSAGWKRTADATRPCDIVPKVSLSAVDPQFSKIINDPFRDEFIRLFLIADGFKYILDFKFDVERFNGGYKVCLPDIVLNEKGVPQFNFSVAYSYTFTEFSSRYIVGVDLGIKLAATAVVWDTKIEQMVHVYTMSRRARSLQNSIN